MTNISLSMNFSEAVEYDDFDFEFKCEKCNYRHLVSHVIDKISLIKAVNKNSNFESDFFGSLSQYLRNITVEYRRIILSCRKSNRNYSIGLSLGPINNFADFVCNPEEFILEENGLHIIEHKYDYFPARRSRYILNKFGLQVSNSEIEHIVKSKTAHFCILCDVEYGCYPAREVIDAHIDACLPKFMKRMKGNDYEIYADKSIFRTVSKYFSSLLKSIFG